LDITVEEDPKKAAICSVETDLLERFCGALGNSAGGGLMLRVRLLVGLRWVSSSVIVLVVVVVIPTNRLSILARDIVWKGIE
jgi:hypothetical protein